LGSDGSGSKNFDPSQVRSIFCGSGSVSHLWFGFEFGKFPLKMSNFFIFFPLDQKKSLLVRSKAGRLLIYCGSKVSLGWVESGPISSFGGTCYVIGKMNKTLNIFNEIELCRNEIMGKMSIRLLPF